ncbi:MAG TPA: hypothetical protein VFZ61_31570, partial [Polyangiales bacterium]
MQARAKYLGLTLQLCCACASKEHEHAIDEVLEDAGTHDAVVDDGELDTPVDLDAGAPSDAPTPQPALDASSRDVVVAEASTHDATTLDGSPLEAGAQDACAGDACVAAACSLDQPCSAPDALCIQGLCQVDPAAPAAGWQRSSWSGRAGVVRMDDTTFWCTPALRQASDQGAAQVRGELHQVALQGPRSEAVTAPHASVRVRAQCFADAQQTGASSLVTSTWSADAEQDRTALTCPPERP